MAYRRYLLFLITISLDGVHGDVKTVDLTHTFDNVTVYWPTARRFKFTLTDAGSNVEFEYKAYKFCTAEHGGTHMDSPVHFAAGGQTTHEVPLERLIGKSFIVDVSEEVANNRDLLVTIDHLEAAEKLRKTTMDDKVVLLYTGYSHHWPHLNKYLGTSSTNTSLLHFPGIHPDAARWIVANRRVKSIGIDTASIDEGQSVTFDSHRILFKANIPAFENVNLKDIEEFRSRDDTMIYALPMKIKGGSGAPLRIVATYDYPMESGGSRVSLSMMTVCIVFVNQYILW